LLTLATFREYLKARLNNFESPATGLLEDPATASLEDPSSTTKARSVPRLDKIQTGARDTRSRRKRNHDQIEFSGTSFPDDQQELPVKRRRIRKKTVDPTSLVVADNTSTSAEQQANARSRMVVEIHSSKETSHSVTPDRDEEFNYAEEEEDADYQPQRLTTPVSEGTQSGEDARIGFTPPLDEITLPLSERILRLNKIIEPDYRMREKDLERGRKRASNGLLLTKDGKVDRRSLRFLGDQENQTPSRWSLAPKALRTGSETVANHQLSDPFELPIFASIENFASGLDHRSTSQRSDPLRSSTTPRDQKPFKCGTCKKQYTSRSSLKYHQEHAKNDECKKGEGNVSPEEFSCTM
jgi:hypothetical protein